MSTLVRISEIADWRTHAVISTVSRFVRITQA